VIGSSCRTLDHDQLAGDKKRVLDDIVFETIREGHTSETRDRAFCELAQKNARLYLDSPWMQVPWLTVRVLTNLIDSLLYPMKDELAAGHVPGRFTSLLPQPWGTLGPALLSLCFFVGSAIVIAVLFILGLPWAGWLVGAFLVWHYVHRYRVNREIIKVRSHMLGVVQTLEPVRAEIASNCYDGETIANRLQGLEDKGVPVPSLLYPLLRIGTHG
jgi:hypothetical protein